MVLSGHVLVVLVEQRLLKVLLMPADDAVPTLPPGP